MYHHCEEAVKSIFLDNSLLFALWSVTEIMKPWVVTCCYQKLKLNPHCPYYVFCLTLLKLAGAFDKLKYTILQKYEVTDRDFNQNDKSGTSPTGKWYIDSSI